MKITTVKKKRGRIPRFNEPVKTVQISVPISKVEQFKKSAKLILKKYQREGV